MMKASRFIQYDSLQNQSVITVRKKEDAYFWVVNLYAIIEDAFMKNDINRGGHSYVLEVNDVPEKAGLDHTIEVEKYAPLIAEKILFKQNEPLGNALLNASTFVL
jgi:hypothetical protein